MGRNIRELSGRQALAASLAAQFDRALAEAADAMDLLDVGWDESGPGGGHADEPDATDTGADFLPLEFQLADLERAVDTMLDERDRHLDRARSTTRDEALADFEETASNPEPVSRARSR